MKATIILLLCLLPVVLSKCKLQHKNINYDKCNLECKIVSCDEPYFNAFDHVYDNVSGHDYELFLYLSHARQPLDITKHLFHNAQIHVESHIGTSNWITDRIIDDKCIDDLCKMAFNDIHYPLSENCE